MGEFAKTLNLMWGIDDVYRLNGTMKRIEREQKDFYSHREISFLTSNDYKYTNLKPDHIEKIEVKPRRKSDTTQTFKDVRYYAKEDVLKALESKIVRKVNKLFAPGAYSIDDMISRTKTKIKELEDKLFQLENSKESIDLLLKDLVKERQK